MLSTFMQEFDPHLNRGDFVLPPSDDIERKAAVVLILTLWVIASGMRAETRQGRSSPTDLVINTVANELKAANAPGHYMYRMRIQKADETQLKEMVETKDWLIGRLIQINGKSLTTKQARKEEDRLVRLLKDESLRRQEAKDQQDTERQVRDLL